MAVVEGDGLIHLGRNGLPGQGVSVSGIDLSAPSRWDQKGFAEGDVDGIWADQRLDLFPRQEGVPLVGPPRRLVEQFRQDFAAELHG